MYVCVYIYIYKLHGGHAAPPLRLPPLHARPGALRDRPGGGPDVYMCMCVFSLSLYIYIYICVMMIIIMVMIMIIIMMIIIITIIIISMIVICICMYIFINVWPRHPAASYDIPAGLAPEREGALRDSP